MFAQNIEDVKVETFPLLEKAIDMDLRKQYWFYHSHKNIQGGNSCWGFGTHYMYLCESREGNRAKYHKLYPGRQMYKNPCRSYNPINILIADCVCNAWWNKYFCFPVRSICTAHELSAADLVAKWFTYSATKNDVDLTLDVVDDFNKVFFYHQNFSLKHAYNQINLSLFKNCWN